MPARSVAIAITRHGRSWTINAIARTLTPAIAIGGTCSRGVRNGWLDGPVELSRLPGVWDAVCGHAGLSKNGAPGMIGGDFGV